MTHDKFSVEAGQVNGDAGSPAGAGTDFAAVSASGGALDGALAQFSRLVEALGVARDELAEQSLTLWRSSQADRESAALWHGRFDLAPCAYVVTDAEGIVCAANAAATDLLGTPRPFLLGKPLAIFVPRRDQRRFYVELYRLRHQEQRLNWRLRLQPRGGSPLEVSANVRTVRSADGAIECLLWLLQDASSTLDSQAERLRGLVARLPCALIEAAVDGTLVSANPAAARLLGYPSADVLLAETGHVRSLYAQPGADEPIRLIGDEQGVSDFEFEALLRHRDGRRIAAQVSIRPFWDAQSHIAGADILLLPKRTPARRQRQ